MVTGVMVTGVVESQLDWGFRKMFSPEGEVNPDPRSRGLDQTTMSKAVFLGLDTISRGFGLTSLKGGAALFLLSGGFSFSVRLDRVFFSH